MSEDDTTPPTAMERPAKPAEDTDATRTVSPAPRPVLALDEGTRIGRYVIQERIGRGGMGVVYRAYDPELDRRIALKLLRVDLSRGADAAERARERMLREAQALAQLNHPNVVAAHDAGTVDGDVFMAMELVEGETLRRWQKRPRPLAEVLAVVVAAGRGLAAAHAAGLVHRDVKPENLLVGADGRVRVADFGLARSSDLTDLGHELPGDSLELSLDSMPPSGRRVSSRLTQVGAVLGTPGYMSPEQCEGDEVDARSDQFSFCVCVWEAVCHQRPFPATSLEEYRRQVGSGVITPPPPGTRMPRWLRRALERGMAATPEQRFASMDELLAELSRDHRVARRRALTAAALLLAAAGVFLLARRGGAPEPPCRGVDAAVFEAWNLPARQQVERAFLASHRVHAADSLGRVAGRLDRWTEGWAAMRREACTATRVTGVQSEALLDLRMQCLDRRLGEVRALIELLARADAGMVDRAVDAVLDLEEVDDCGDADRVAAAYPPPPAPLAPRIAWLAGQLDRARALGATGRYRDGIAVAEPAVREIDATGYRPLLASGLFRLGTLELRAGDRDRAGELFGRAGRVAAATHQDDLIADAAASLLYLSGVLRDRGAEALAQADMVDLMIARAGDDPARRADAMASRGYVLFRAERLDEAERTLTEALALAEKARGPSDHLVAHVLNYLAMVQNQRGDLAAGQASFERAVAIWEEQFGRNHPVLISGLNNLGQTLLIQGQFGAAERSIRRALQIATATLGAAHVKTGIGELSLGQVELLENRCDAAVPLFEAAQATFEATLGGDHPYVGHVLAGLGECDRRAGRTAEARLRLERACILLKREADGGATAGFSLAQLLWDDRGDRRRAIDLARRALDGYQGVAPLDQRRHAEVAAWLGQHPAARAPRR